MKIKPETRLGKWSVGLNIFFLIVIVISIILVKVLGIFSFDNTWWDITVPIIFSATIAAFVIGIITIIKNKEHSVLVCISIILSILAILFVLLHSLFIND